jgi:hypothetical protein
MPPEAPWTEAQWRVHLERPLPDPADPRCARLLAAARRQPGFVERSTGLCKFQCPACRAEERDASRDNACLFLTQGKWGCAVNPEHWRAIGEALGAFADAAPPAAGAVPPAPAARFRPAEAVMRDPPPVAVIAGVVWQRCVTVVVSESGAGKTFVLLDLGGAVTAGHPWQGRAVRQGSVAFMSFEGDALGLRLRALAEAGTDLRHLHVLQAGEPLSPASSATGANLRRPGRSRCAGRWRS